MQVWSLASGSSGNCYLVRENDCLLLLEAGLAASRIENEIARLGLRPADVAAVLASHEHVDHWLSAVALSRRVRAPLICTPGTWHAGNVASPARCEHLPLRPGSDLRLGRISVEAFSVSHDAAEPVGFVLRTSEAAICLATDLGFATEEVLARAREADLAIVESNHDVDMLNRGPYPAALKARILGDLGHLSNEAAARAIARMAEGKPRRFWLAHLSDTNNSPPIALASVRSLLRSEGLGDLKLSVALRDRRSLFWDSDGLMEQLPLF